MQPRISFYLVSVFFVLTSYAYPVIYNAGALQPITYARASSESDRKPFFTIQSGFNVPSAEGVFKVLGLKKLVAGFGDFLGGLTGGSSSSSNERRPTRIRPLNDEPFDDEIDEMDEIKTHRPAASKKKDKAPVINLIFITPSQPSKTQSTKQPPNIKVLRLPSYKPKPAYSPPFKGYGPTEYGRSLTEPFVYPVYYYYSQYPYNYQPYYYTLL